MSSQARRRRPAGQAHEVRTTAKSPPDWLVDLAAEVFGTRGYDATSVTDLMEAAEITKGGLYYHIDGKADLLPAIHDRCMLPMLERARAVDAAGLSPKERMRALVRVMIDAHFEFHYHVMVILHEWRTLAKHPRWPEIHAQRRELEDVFARAIDDGVADGTFHAHHPKLALLSVLGMLNYVYVWLDVDGALDAPTIADEMANIVLGGLERSP